MFVEADLERNIAALEASFTQTPDLVTRRFRIRASGKEACLVYLDELTDRIAVNRDILQRLMHEGESAEEIEQLVTVGGIKRTEDLAQTEQAILQGKSALFVQESRFALLLDTQGWPQRAIDDPQLEAALKGAHQGFVETASQNIAMIRRFIPNRELKIKEFLVGKRGATKVSVLFLADVASPDIVSRAEERLSRIDVDAVLGAGELEQFLEDRPYSPFPQFSSTERPDSAASQLLQGRLAFVVDRSPGVLIAPASFGMFFQSFDDYSIRWPIATFLRLLRFAAFFITLFLPAVYIAVITYHFEVIPLQFLLSVGEHRANVPFTPILEALLMEITLEMLKEAGLRLPGPIGQTVGIVGAIVIGQAAVEAGFVSNFMVIVVALTGLSSFIIPNQDMAAVIRLLRFPMMLLAATFGLVGVCIGAMTLLGYMISLESLGFPYLTPISPLRWTDWKDLVIRVPLQLMKRRPVSTRPTDRRRQGDPETKGGRA